MSQLGLLKTTTAAVAAASVQANCEHKCAYCVERSRDNHSEFCDKSSNSSNRRLSVASLSRNFDNRARSSLNGENEQPNEQPGTSSSNQNSTTTTTFRQESATSTTAGQRRQPLGNLNAQLREHNASRQQRQQNPSNGRDGATNSTTGGREELVPKHVTITPQAFLKFFSL